VNSNSLAEINTTASRPGNSRSYRSSFDPPYYVKALAMGLTAYLIGIHLWTWIFTLPTFLGGRADFRQLYTAGYIVRTGHAVQLYDYASQLAFQRAHVGPGDVPLPFIRPAFEALLFVPLSYLSYKTAYFCFLSFNVMLLALCFLLLRPRMNNLAHVWRPLPAAMFFGYLPLAAALIQGQDSVLLLTLLIAAFVLLDRGKDLFAGILIGLGLFKFQIVIPIALLFLVWRRWRFISGFAIPSSIATLFSIWLVGVSQFESYGRSLFSVSTGMVSPANQFRYPIPVAQMPNLHGLLTDSLHAYISGPPLAAAAILLSLLVLAVAIVGAHARRGSEPLLVAITTAAIVSYYLLIHDMSILLLPITIVLNRYLPGESCTDDKSRWLARAAALMFVAPVCFSFIPDHFSVVAIALLLFWTATLIANRHARHFLSLSEEISSEV
jgi:hypothetical protein